MIKATFLFLTNKNSTIIICVAFQNFNSYIFLEFTITKYIIIRMNIKLTFPIITADSNNIILFTLSNII